MYSYSSQDNIYLIRASAEEPKMSIVMLHIKLVKLLHSFEICQLDMLITKTVF